VNKRQTERLERLLKRHNEAQWEAAEWNRDESEQPWERVYARSVKAEAALRKAIGLPEVTLPEVDAKP
jgi:hypothetical protein